MQSCKFLNIELWQTIRKPFVYPQNLVHHKCVWEKIDIDMAGCTLCGWVHICSELHDDVDHFQKNVLKKKQTFCFDTKCQKMVEMDHVVCAITGCCLQDALYSELEFVDTAAFAPTHSPKNNKVSFEFVLFHVREILCSEKAVLCFEQERKTTDNKLKLLFTKVMRDYRVKNPYKPPDIFLLVSNFLINANNLKEISETFDVVQREHIAQKCSISITRFFYILENISPEIFNFLKKNILIVGLLYLMRTGLSIFDMGILPKIDSLISLLPIENNLMHFFQIKCKYITETENLVKLQLRKTCASKLRQQGIQHLDL